MAILRYTALRVLVFLVVAALLWLVGLRGFWLLLVAVFASGVISLFVLRGSREAVSSSLDWRMSTIKQRMAERAAAEDAWDEARRQQEGSGDRPDASHRGPGSTDGRATVPRDGDAVREADGDTTASAERQPGSQESSEQQPG